MRHDASLARLARGPVAAALALALALVAAAHADDETVRVFPNGAEVVVLPAGTRGVAAVPSQVAVVVAYRAGARDEARDDAGLAHLAERLHARAATDGLVALEGERFLDAFGPARHETLHALTFFASTVPQARAALPLEIERQRLATLAPTEDLFQDERAAVLAEVLKVEVALVPRAWNAMLALAFGDHGLGRPRLGQREAVARATLERTAAWRRARYRPDAALVVIAGAPDPEAAIALVASSIGTVARPEAPLTPAPAAPLPAKGPLRVSLEAGAVAERALLLAWRGPDAGDPAEAAFLALAFDLRERLEKALGGIARSLELTCDPRSPDPLLLVVRALPGARRDLPELEAKILDLVRRARAEGVADPGRAAARVLRQLDALGAPLDARLDRAGPSRAAATLLQAAIDRAIADPLVRRRAALAERLRTLTATDVAATAATMLADERLRVVVVDVAKK